MSSQLKRLASDSDSESESESEEEGTTKSNVNSKQQELPQQQQQKQTDGAASEAESETDSDSEPDSRYNIVKRETNSRVATKGPANDNVQGKRARDVNGAKGAPLEEPSSKKRKGAKEDKARSQPEKISSPVKFSSPAKKVEKAEPAARGTKTTAAGAKTEKAKGSAAKVENARPQATGRKRRASPQPAPSKQQAQKVEVEKSSPMKPKKTATWSAAVEESLVNLLHKDHSSGIAIPITKGDAYWERLLKRLTLEGDMTEVQLCEKVRRMKLRYQTLKERPKGEGGKLFKSPHEEKIFQLWAEIWGPGTKTSQPAAEEDDSEDDSEDTTAAPGQVIKDAAGQVNEGDSGSDDENEEDAEDAKRKTDGLNQVNADSKVIPEVPVVSPFISKPRLAFTPLVPKGDKRSAMKRVEEEEATRELHTEDLVPRDDGKKGDVVILAEEHLKQLRQETLAFFQELRGSCFQAMEEQRNGSLTGGLGNLAFSGKGFGFLGMLEGFQSGSGSQAAVELQRKWREHKIQELALLSDRLQLLQEQCRLQQEELKLQNQRQE